MAELISPITPAFGSFDTAFMQIARAQAQAIAANKNQEAFLREIARSNDNANARALTATAASQPSDPFFNSGLPEEEPTIEPADPANQPSPLSIFGVGTEVTSIPEISRAQQLHDIAILQKDVELLQEAANANIPRPLSNAATTLDLSPTAREIVDASNADEIARAATKQLAQLISILQTAANAPLAPDVLQQLQVQLAADKNPIKLSLSTIAAAMSYIAGAQQNPNYVATNTNLPDTGKLVIAPVAAIDSIALDGGTIR